MSDNARSGCGKNELARTPVHFPPVLNGLDFLESTATLLSVEGDVPPRNLKYAVVHLAAAVETLLKARLALEDPRMVWTYSDQYDEAKHAAGAFRSVDWEEARKRVKKECAPETELLEPRFFKALADMRNRFAHVGVTEDARTVEVLTTPMLDFLLAFVHTDVLPLVPDDEAAGAEEAMDRIRPALGKIRPLVDQRLEHARGLRANYILPCRVCAALAVPINGDDTLVCVVCLHDYGTPTEAAWTYADSSEYEAVTDGGEYAVSVHEECGGPATDVPNGAAGADTEATVFLCLSCGSECAGVCGYCGQAVSAYAIPEANMCDNCLNYKMAKF
ncbi:hypothetical protein OG345_41690 (plasmid) [Streptomyces sp. NBC_01220]|uniref:hypothetical protein n=1 Tax=Streptomyces sp. NBC_01220 TaxID=2903781 RepID=UPI00352E04E0|nr:hypothetical protein OG345_41690 [Streptomyces sp. NBC_01220]